MMHSGHRRIGWVLSTTLMVVSTMVVAALTKDPLDQDPQHLIADMTERLLNELQSNTEAIKQDEAIAYRISDRLVVPILDFKRITRLVIGKHWRRASGEQKKKLTNELRALIIRSYVTAMRTYADQIVINGKRISYLPSRYKPGDKKATVRAVIQLEGGSPVEVHYLLYRSGGQWKIYDIRIEGVSLAITYRTSFGAEIQRSGLDGLIAQLEERNRQGAVELPPKVGVPLNTHNSLH